ncbi:Rho-binding antiterminator [Pseudoalteromonas arctica]|uniref:Rho-binding antiterminator n=1 Tax=Pseudoalteromonas arctica TaxID=394751 RepID=A0A7Y0DTL5_9GAMM|nr:Rho-binding antiterminator [Pseudoalteromonas arctica]NMM41400.1 Rho-binding antiterminator [Pseudoalteromonas arctica]
MSYQPIKCADYDQYELFCIQSAVVKISTIDGLTLIGKAKNLLNLKGEGEFLLIEQLEKGEHKVRLDEIKAISYF